MRSLSKAALLILASFSLAIVPAAPALAAETSSSDIFIVRPGETLSDDLYAGAVKVLIQGRLDGDLFAFAADEVVVDGEVTGSVTAVAPRVTISGAVGGAVRVSGGSLEVTGTVGRDVVAAVRAAEFGPPSRVDGDVIIWALDARSSGSVGGDLGGSQRGLELSGSVVGDVDVSVGALEISGPLEVGGDLDYRSGRPARGLEQAAVGGAVVHKTPLPPNIRVRALGLFGRMMTVLFLTIAALTVAWGWPDRTRAAAASVARHPVRAWWRGALVVFAPVLAMALVALMLALAPPTASLPLLALFVPLVLALIGIVLALSLVAGTPVAVRIGNVVARRLSVYGAVVLGSALIGVAWMVPVIGWLVPLTVLPLGIGAWWESRPRREVEEVTVAA
jgi:hypothetical protein